MFAVLKFIVILLAIKLMLDILRYAIIEIYYERRGWTSGICTYGIDENGIILSNIPNRFVKLLMDSRGWEYTTSYKFSRWCVRLVSFKGEA